MGGVSIFSDEEWDEMDDDERDEWEYRQRIQDREENERPKPKVNTMPGTNVATILLQKAEELRLAAIATIESQTNEALEPKPQVESTDQRLDRMSKEVLSRMASKEQENPEPIPVAPEPSVVVVAVEEVVEPIEAPTKPPVVSTKASNVKVKDDLFIKTSIGLLKGTMIRDLGAPCFTTLMVLSGFMDNKGVCYPSQETLAELAGVNRQTVCRHIAKLEEYRTPDGSPILESRKEKVPGMPYSRLIYRILPASGLSFG